MNSHFAFHHTSFSNDDLSQTSFPDFCLLAYNILMQETRINDEFSFAFPQDPSIPAESINEAVQYGLSTCNKFPSFHNHFEILEPIGQGSFSKIYKVRSRYDGKLYCAKQLPPWQCIDLPPLHIPTRASYNAVESANEQITMSENNSTTPSTPLPLSYNQLLSYQFPQPLSVDYSDDHNPHSSSHYARDLAGYTEREYITITSNLVTLRELATMMYCSSKGLCDTTTFDPQPSQQPHQLDTTSTQQPQPEYTPIIPLLSICEEYSVQEDERQAAQNHSSDDGGYAPMERQLFLILPLYTHTLQDLLDLSLLDSPPPQSNTDMSQSTEQASIQPTQPHSITPTIPQPIAYSILHTIARGVKVLHDHNIIHRDLKPSNILYDQHSGKFALCDFGSVRYFPSSRPHPLHPSSPSPTTPSNNHSAEAFPQLLNTDTPASLHPVMSSLSGPHGTLGYKPLDLLLLNPTSSLPALNYPGYAIDIWAFGCIAFGLLGFYSRTGLLPPAKRTPGAPPVPPNDMIKTIVGATVHGLPIVSHCELALSQQTEPQAVSALNVNPNLTQSSHSNDLTATSNPHTYQTSPNEHSVQLTETLGLFKFILSSLFNTNSQSTNQRQQVASQGGPLAWSEFTAAQYLFAFITPYPIIEPFLFNDSNSTPSPLQNEIDPTTTPTFPSAEDPTSTPQLTSTPTNASNPQQSSSSRAHLSPASFQELTQELLAWPGFPLVYQFYATLCESTDDSEFQPPSGPLPLLKHLLQPHEYNLLAWCLALLPHQRPTSADILDHRLFSMHAATTTSVSSWLSPLLARAAMQEEEQAQESHKAEYIPSIYDNEDDFAPYSTNPYSYDDDDDDAMYYGNSGW